MTEIFINKQKAIFKEDSNIKLTIENTFYENSGSYTLDVTFPLDIEQNRIVFGSINRMEASKRYKTFDATILVDSKLVFKGTAKITSVSDIEVKLQLLSGNSRVKFWTKAQKMYIDAFQYDYTDRNNTLEGFVQYEGFLGTPLIRAGSFPGRKREYCYVPVLDANGSQPETDAYKGLWNEHHLLIDKDEQMLMYHGGTVENPHFYIELKRQCICPNLMFVTKWILNHLGYTIRRNDRDNDFVNSIYIATATHTTTHWHTNTPNSADENAMAKALPHWTVEEFIKQLQNFLNVKIVFNDIENTVDILDTIYDDGVIDLTDQVQDDYEVELIDDEDAKEMLYNSNIKYKKGAVGGNYRAEMVDQEVISAFNLIKCSYITEVFHSYESMSEEEKKRAIWSDEREGHQFCTNNEGNLIRFNYFGSLVRNENNTNDIELKISPVDIATDVPMPVFEYSRAGGAIYRDAFDYRWTCKQTVLFLENKYEAANKTTVWDAVTENSEDQEEKKEDIMQVFFMDEREHSTGFYTSNTQYPFTDFTMHNGYCRRAFTFNLRRNDSWSIGYYHNKGKAQNRNAEYRFKFKADAVPSVYSKFIIRNKQYACKKLEVQFTSKGMDEIIMGYFEEITQGNQTQ